VKVAVTRVVESVSADVEDARKPPADVELPVFCVVESVSADVEDARKPVADVELSVIGAMSPVVVTASGLDVDVLA